MRKDRGKANPMGRKEKARIESKGKAMVNRILISRFLDFFMTATSVGIRQ